MDMGSVDAKLILITRKIILRNAEIQNETVTNSHYFLLGKIRPCHAVDFVMCY